MDDRDLEDLESFLNKNLNVYTPFILEDISIS